MIACADLYVDIAKKKAEQYGIMHGYSVDEILNDPSIDIILNLTIPNVHAKVSLAILESGKHVYSEKPLATTYLDGKKVIEKAKEKNLQVGCAPDTFLGGRLQTIRKTMDEGIIGLPIAASAFTVSHGPEMWHPDPGFLYKKGAGPLFDMGPYYLTALISLLGPIKSIFGSCKTSFDKRTISSQPKNGEVIDVEVPTHVTGVMNFECGVCATFITSFDVWDSYLPRIEIYGSEGTICIDDIDPAAGPNLFGGDFKLRRKDDGDWNGLPERLPRRDKASPWETIKPQYGNNEDSRGVGVTDMINSIILNTPYRASGEMALHVLEAMEGIYRSNDEGILYIMESTCTQPELLAK